MGTPSRALKATATPFATTALTLLLLSGVVALAGGMIWQNYQTTIAAAEVRAVSAAHVVAAHTQWMVEASDQALRRIEAAFGDRQTWTKPDSIADITQAVGNLPAGFQYSLYDQAGRLRVSSVPEAVGIVVTDREYFQQLRDGAQVVISPQLEERLSGLVVFVVARRLTVNGEFSGAASIAIPAIKMSEFWNSIDLGPFSTVSLVRDDGWLVSRHPQLPQAVNVSEAALFSTYIPAASTGFYHTVSAVDGRTRIAGYRKVADWPLFAVASIDRGEALAPFWTLVRAQMTFGIPVLVLLLAGTIWIARLLRADLLHRLELEQAHERNQLLFREIHHRVKNNLQAVASLVRLQPLPDEARDDMAQRIAAMVAVHEQIYQSDQFDRVEAAPYIDRLVRDVAAAYDSDVQLDLRLEPLRVSRDQALPVGLIVSEVVSNAFKHAFSKRQDGHLSVELVADGDVAARLTIKDDGSGAGDKQHTGMGTRLIAGFVSQVGGTYSLDGTSDGTLFQMTFPLEDRMPDAPVR